MPRFPSRGPVLPGGPLYAPHQGATRRCFAPSPPRSPPPDQRPEQGESKCAQRREEPIVAADGSIPGVELLLVMRNNPKCAKRFVAQEYGHQAADQQRVG